MSEMMIQQQRDSRVPPRRQPPTPREASLAYRLFWPAALVATIVTASGSQVANLPGAFPFAGLDKVAHVLLFGLLATHLVRYPSTLGDRLSFRQALFAIVIVFLFGISDELHQASNPYRTFEYADMLADLGGATLAVILYQRWSFYRNLLECRLKQSRGKLPLDSSRAAY